jgi:hypothetical protein
MTLLGLLAPILGLYKLNFGTDANIDTTVSKLHSRFATSFFLASCVFVSSVAILHPPMTCHTSAVPADFMSTHCWASSTYIVTTSKFAHYIILLGQLRDVVLCRNKRRSNRACYGRSSTPSIL